MLLLHCALSVRGGYNSGHSLHALVIDRAKRSYRPDITILIPSRRYDGCSPVCSPVRPPMLPHFPLIDLTSPSASDSSNNAAGSSPVFCPVSPIPDASHSPHPFTPTTPTDVASLYAPTSPSYNPTSPMYNPTSPSYIPTSPTMLPQPGTAALPPHVPQTTEEWERMLAKFNSTDLERLSALVNAQKHSDSNCKQCKLGSRIAAICRPCEHAYLCRDCALLEGIGSTCDRCGKTIEGFAWL